MAQGAQTTLYDYRLIDRRFPEELSRVVLQKQGEKLTPTFPRL
jgi:hypothetical protein